MPLIWYQIASDSVIGKNHALTILKIKSTTTKDKANQLNALFPLFISLMLGRLGKEKVRMKTTMLKLIWIYGTGFIPKPTRKNKNRLLNAKANIKARDAFSKLKAQPNWLRQTRKEAYHNKEKSIQII